MSHDRGCHCGREKYEYDECNRAGCPNGVYAVAVLDPREPLPALTFEVPGKPISEDLREFFRCVGIPTEIKSIVPLPNRSFVLHLSDGTALCCDMRTY